MSNWTIQFYTNSRGDELVQDFIRSQDKKTKSKIARNIDLVSRYGPNLGMPHSKYINDGIYELRVVGKNNIRIFYISITSRLEIIFLHAHTKKTQKMSTKDYKIAVERKDILTKL